MLTDFTDGDNDNKVYQGLYQNTHTCAIVLTSEGIHDLLRTNYLKIIRVLCNDE